MKYRKTMNVARMCTCERMMCMSSMPGGQRSRWRSCHERRTAPLLRAPPGKRCGVCVSGGKHVQDAAHRTNGGGYFESSSQVVLGSQNFWVELGIVQQTSPSHVVSSTQLDRILPPSDPLPPSIVHWLADEGFFRLA